jgi:hypothetical protein
MAALESLTGVKLAGLIGGLFGSLVTLSYLPSLKNWQRVGAYLTGVVCAAYLPPLVTYFFNLPLALDGPLGFIAGVFGMGLIGAGVTISNDPIGAWKRFKGIPNG